MCRTAPRCRDPDAVAALGVQGEKQAISCKKWKESNKDAKQQGQRGARGLSREKAQEQLIWRKEVVLMGRISTQLLSSLRDRVLERRGLEKPPQIQPVPPRAEPHGWQQESFMMNKPLLFIAHNCQISRRPCKMDLQKKKKKKKPHVTNC